MPWIFPSGDADVGRVFVVKTKKILEGKTYLLFKTKKILGGKTEYYKRTAITSDITTGSTNN